MSQPGVAEPVVRLQLDRLALLLNRLVVAARQVEIPSQDAGMLRRERVELLASFALRDSLNDSSHRHQVPSVCLMSERIIRVEFNGSLELLLSGRPIPVIEPMNGPQIGVRDRETIVYLYGLLCSLLGFGHCFVRRYCPIDDEVVVVRQSVVGQSVVRIDGERLL